MRSILHTMGASAKLNDWYLHTFSALKHKNYRTFWLSQMVSLTGSWIQATAQQYLVLELTQNSGVLLAWVTIAQFAPSLLFSLFAGAIIDRSSRRVVLLLTQSAMLLVAIALATLTYLGVINVAFIMMLAFVHGAATAFDIPARQSMVLDFVPKSSMSNAIALNSLAFNVSRTLGQALFGGIAALGVYWFAGGDEQNISRLALPFYLNVVTFFGVIWVIWRLPFPPRPESQERSNTLEQIKEGLRYVRRTPAIRYVMLLVGGMSLTVINFNVILPYYARAVYGASENLFGWLSAAFGIGAMIGALWQANKPNPVRNLRLGSILMIAGCIALAFTPTPYLALPVLMVCGFGLLALLISANSSVQLVVPNELRGRVMSLFSFVLVGMGPPGALLSGWLLDKKNWLGPQLGLLALAICGALVLLFLWRFLPRHLESAESSDTPEPKPEPDTRNLR